MHLDVILVNNQLDALFLNVFISAPLHVSSSKCSSSGGPTCINTPSGITHSGGRLSDGPVGREVPEFHGFFFDLVKEFLRMLFNC